QTARGLQRSLEQMRALARELQYIRGRASSAGANRGSAAANSGQAVGDGNQAIRPQLEGVAARANELVGQLINQGVETGDLEPVLDKINQLTQAQNELDKLATTELLENALSALMGLEYKLRKQLNDPEYPELLISESTELPDEHKEMVAEYFRTLSHQ
ncbi:MAG: hypothetical protein V3T45_03685, partial [Nitrospinaceae bacterium]